MELNEFIQKFADQFEETDAKTLNAETEFRELEEWSSLIALSVIAMIDEEYDISIGGQEMRSVNTIGELFNLVNGKK